MEYDFIMNRITFTILWITAGLFLLWALTLNSPDASADTGGAGILGHSLPASPADPSCDVYNRTCWPQYCYNTGGWTSPYSGYCPDVLGPPYGRGNTR